MSHYVLFVLHPSHVAFGALTSITNAVLHAVASILTQSDVGKRVTVDGFGQGTLCFVGNTGTVLPFAS